MTPVRPWREILCALADAQLDRATPFEEAFDVFRKRSGMIAKSGRRKAV